MQKQNKTKQKQKQNKTKRLICHKALKGTSKQLQTAESLPDSIGNLNHDNDDENENATNLQFEKKETILLHALHVCFLFWCSSLSSSPRQREILKC